jgi:hypothetical protein
MKILPFVVLLLVVLACSELSVNPSKSTSKPQSQSHSSPNGARLRINSEPKDRTGIYQDNFKIAQPVKINGKNIEGVHNIELSNMAGFSGSTPRCEIESLVINVLHGKPKTAGWQYPRNAKLSFIIDGADLKPNKVTQMDLDEDEGQYWESLISQPTCEIIQKMATASSVVLKIDNATIELSETDRAALKEFAATIGFN